MKMNEEFCGYCNYPTKEDIYQSHSPGCPISGNVNLLTCASFMNAYSAGFKNGILNQLQPYQSFGDFRSTYWLGYINGKDVRERIITFVNTKQLNISA